MFVLNDFNVSVRISWKVWYVAPTPIFFFQKFIYFEV